MKIKSPYLNLKRLKKPKDDFFTCLKILKKHTNINNKVIIDIGCANGEFLNFLKKNRPNNFYIGVDSNSAFLKVAKQNKNLNNVKFIKKDLFSLKKNNLSDISICMGVSHLLKDIRKLINKLLMITKNNGIVVIDGFFNEYDIDTITYFKDYSSFKNIKWRNDFNQFSMRTIENFLRKKKLKNFNFVKAELRSKVSKDHFKKPHHFIWTEKNGKKNIVTNGTNIFLKRKFLIINK